MGGEKTQILIVKITIDEYYHNGLTDNLISYKKICELGHPFKYQSMMILIHLFRKERRIR